MSTLICHDCGNYSVWRNARQDRNGNQSATCGDCGATVTSSGGTSMGTVTGGMRQTR
ncbi:hypothetical protein ACFY2R_05235 [Micromonospora olivasterospora]|uniref:Uncharacterized protein n=1 Tax=Micromonospora olivasterospora TaxID=1880 RepID=A0A562I8I4_MICOL|nr:hypothetical protein [Micromonospora olivasterospora]TWH67309.1 hypothetical protein JD77_02283 [Micromonospora olivasterospora]